MPATSLRKHLPVPCASGAGTLCHATSAPAWLSSRTHPNVVISPASGSGWEGPWGALPVPLVVTHAFAPTVPDKAQETRGGQGESWSPLGNLGSYRPGPE